jgi:hypothetical protein
METCKFAQRSQSRLGWFFLIAVVVGGIWWALDRVRTADHAERALHACILATDLLEQYVVATGGGWPSSWDDLEGRVQSSRDNTMYSWPRDRREVERFVDIEFAAQPESLARAEDRDFEPLKPRGSCFTTYNRHFSFLLEALRRFHPRNGTGDSDK